METTTEPMFANDVARGVTRMFLQHDLMSVSEVSLGNGRRADIFALCSKGFVTIVEIKVSRADLLSDLKWPDYLDYCDRFFWAVPPGFNTALFDRAILQPDRTGLIVADRYDGAIVRHAPTVALAPARRKVETLRFARRAARRLLLINEIDDFALVKALAR